MWWYEHCESEKESDREFIDHAHYDENVENYQAFDNVSRDYNDAINDSLSGFYFSQEVTNYYSDDEIEEVVLDNFKDSKKKVDEYKKLWQILMGTTTLILFFFLQLCMQFVFN